eukprot:1155212-Pelagomonas_calceolata.AAC.5
MRYLPHPRAYKRNNERTTRCKQTLPGAQRQARATAEPCVPGLQGEKQHASTFSAKMQGQRARTCAHTHAHAHTPVDGGIHDLHDVAKLLWAHQLAAQHRPTPADAVVVDAIPARRRRARATLGTCERVSGMFCSTSRISSCAVEGSALLACMHAYEPIRMRAEYGDATQVESRYSPGLRQTSIRMLAG